jgi:hypothetical protein
MHVKVKNFPYHVSRRTKYVLGRVLKVLICICICVILYIDMHTCNTFLTYCYYKAFRLSTTFKTSFKIQPLGQVVFIETSTFLGRKVSSGRLHGSLKNEKHHTYRGLKTFKTPPQGEARQS